MVNFDGKFCFCYLKFVPPTSLNKFLDIGTCDWCFHHGLKTSKSNSFVLISCGPSVSPMCSLWYIQRCLFHEKLHMKVLLSTFLLKRGYSEMTLNTSCDKSSPLLDKSIEAILLIQNWFDAVPFYSLRLYILPVIMTE